MREIKIPNSKSQIPRRLTFAFLVFLFACGSASEPPAQPTDALSRALEPRTTWMGLYLGASKIGWSRTAIERTPENDYRLVNETYMLLKMMGTRQESRTTLLIEFTRSLDPLSYVFSLRTPVAATDAGGAVKDGVLSTWMKTAQGRREQSIRLEKDMDLFGLADLRRAAEGYKPGEVYEGKIFEPTFFTVLPYKVQIVDTQVVKLGGSEETVYRVKATMSDIESLSYTLANGDVIRVEGPMGIVMKRETEESAKDMSAEGNLTDLILSFSVDAGRMVDDPASIRRAVLGVKGLSARPYPGGVQTASAPDSSGEVTVTIDLDAPQAKDSRAAECLKATTYTQSDDSRVIAKAREIVGGEKDPAKIVQKIFAWVHENMHQEPAFTLPSTVDVLATMRGDCNEHAALMCGLLRAAGVPTRVAAGLVYMKGRFYYHAWNECYVAGRWMPVDATFGENPAGALRLRISVGEIDEQMKIAGVAGKIAMRIMEVR